MSQNTTPTSNHPQDGISFPPVPLASGNTVTDALGDQRQVIAVSIKITAAASHTPMSFDLEEKFGGWWKLARGTNTNDPQSTDANVVAAHSAPTDLTIPPIPLVSGDILTDTEGNQHPVTDVTLVITTDDSHAPIEIALHEQFGGWWAPKTAT